MSRAPLRSLTALRPARLTRTRPGVVHLLTALALAGGLAYLVWRALFTVAGAPLWLSVPLLVAEAVGWTQLAHLAVEAWVAPGAAEGGDCPGTRQVVVLAAGAAEDAVERTLLGCREMDGEPEVLVARLAGDATLDGLCTRIGARVVVVPDATPGAALAAAQADLVFLVGAGAVPTGDALDQAAWRLGAGGAVAAQCRAEATDAGIASAVAGGGGGTLLQDVLHPSLGARGVVMAQAHDGLLVRRGPALAALAGRPAMRAAAALLGRRGRVVFAPQAVVRTVPAASLEGFLDQAGRDARQGLGLFLAPEGPVRGRGLGWLRRVVLAGPALRALTGPRMLVLLAVLAGALVSGRAPLDAPIWLIGVCWGVWVVLATGAWAVLERGTRAIGDRTRGGLRLMGQQGGALVRAILLRPARAASGGSRRGLAALSRLGLLVGALVIVNAALAVRGVAQHMDLGLPVMPRGPLWVLVGFAALAALLMLDVLQLVVLLRQDRRAVRMAVDLPVRVGGAPARVVDLTPAGLRLAGVPAAARPGDRLALTLTLPGRDGGTHDVALSGLVRNVAGQAAGVELVDVDEAAREALLTYYWVTRPARLRAGLDAPSAPVPGGASAGPLLGRRLSALSRVATLVGAAGLVLALLPASAQAATGGATVTLKKPVVSPGIGAFGRYNINISKVAAPGFPFLPGDKRAHCVEFDQGAATGAGELNSGPQIALRNDANGPAGNARIKWLMLSDYASETSPAPLTAAQQVAAHQSAIWALTNPTKPLGDPQNVRAPGSDAKALARARELYAAVTEPGFSAAWVDQAPALAADGPAVCAGEARRTVGVTGAPWAAVALSVPEGGTIWVGGASRGRTTQIRLDGDGRVDVEVAGSGPGAVTLTAAFEAPTLVQSRNGVNKSSQDFVYLEFETVTRTIELRFLDCRPLTAEATATPGFTRAFDWAVAKSAGVESPVITTEDTVRVPYTVTVTRTAQTDSGFAVEGAVTVRNPNADPVSGVTVTARVEGVDCPVTGGGGTLPAGGAARSAFACTLPARADGAVAVSVGWARPGLPDGSASARAEFAFTAPTRLVRPSVVVTDTAAEFAGPRTVAHTDPSPQAFTYERVLDVPTGRAACTGHDNVARIALPDGTPQGTAARSVTICRETRDLVVTTTAEPAYTRSFDWDIAKSASPRRQEADADTASVAYTVRVTRSAPVDSGFTVRGVITLTNPNPFPVPGVTVTDDLPGATCAVGGAAGAPVSVPARRGSENGTLEVPYSCTRPDRADGEHTATATWSWTPEQAAETGDRPGPQRATGTAPVVFGAPTVVRNERVRVTDTPEGGEPVVLAPALETGGSFMYARQVPVPEVGCRTRGNVARFTALDGDDAGQAGASAEVCRRGRDLVVTKTAAPSFTRTYDWDLTKSAGPASSVVGDEATRDVPVTYTITATKGAGTDSAWRVGGLITVENPNPFPVDGVRVSDDLPGARCAVAGEGALSVPAAGSASIAYDCVLDDRPAADQPVVNTATATWDRDAYVTPAGSATGTASARFDRPTDLVNDAVRIGDAFDGASEQVLATEISETQTFTQVRRVPVPGDGCATVANIAVLSGVGSPAFRREATALAEVCRRVPASSPAGAPDSSATPATPSGSPARPARPATARGRIALTKRGPRQATAGQAVPYSISVRNAGRAPVSGVVVTDVLPAGTSLAARASGASLRAGSLSWRVGRLAPGASRTFRVLLRLDAQASGGRCNVARATGRGVGRAAATTCMQVAPLARRITPAVTG